MPLTFTRDSLRDRAGSSVFNRGVKYFQNDLVGEIKTVVDKYTVKVHGRNVYNVEYSPDEDTFSCNCPYDGFCKHSVAFGLKLLDEKEQLTPTISFDGWYNSISDELKILFLEHLVCNDIALKKKLDRMSHQADDDAPVVLNDIAEAVYNVIDTLSYEDALDSYQGYNYYVEEYEVIDDLVSSVLDEYLSVIGEYIKFGKPDRAFDHILGIYLGLQKSSDTEIAEYLDDLENFLYEPELQFVQSLKQQPDSLKLKMLNRFIKFCENNPVNSFYLFKDFLLLFVKEKYSDMLKKFLLAFPDDYAANEILMKIAESEQDMELMKKLLKKNDTASMHLPYLNLLQKKGEFEKIKQILIKFYDTHDICTLKQFVLPELGAEIYKKLLLKLIVTCFKLEYYKKYKQLLTENEKQKFLSGIAKDISYSKEKYALPILFYEKLYKPVLKIIEVYSTNEYCFESYVDYLKEISKTMPGEVWEIFLKRTNFLFSIRKRSSYATVTYYLNIMKGIDKGKTNELIQAYYNHKPLLPALRDEFEKAGIV